MLLALAVGANADAPNHLVKVVRFAGWVLRFVATPEPGRYLL